MLRIRNRFTNRCAMAVLLTALTAVTVLLPGCTEPLTLYHVPGSEVYLAQGKKVLVLPFMDTRTYVSKEDKERGDIGSYTRDIFVEALHEFQADRVLEIMTPKMPRRTKSLTNAQVAELGRQYGADLIVAGQVFSFAGTRAASIPPRAGIFLRIINAQDGALLFVGDHYRAANVPGADGGRDLQALYVSARLIEGFISKLQPALMAAGEISSWGALAMLSPEPVKRGLIARMFRPKEKQPAPKRKLFAWRNSSASHISLGKSVSDELIAGDILSNGIASGKTVTAGNGQNGNSDGGRNGGKKREPGNVPETERYLGMTASFLFDPEQWDDQFVPEVPPLIDFDKNFYQLPAPEPGEAPPLPIPPVFADGDIDESLLASSEKASEKTDEDDVLETESGESADSASAIAQADTQEHGDVAQISEEDAAEEDDVWVASPKPASMDTEVAASATEKNNTPETDAAHDSLESEMMAQSEGQGNVNAQTELAATDAEKSSAPLQEYRNIVVDTSSAMVIDELPEIDMSKVYPNIMPADAPYPAPAPSAKLSGDDLASDLFATDGETWHLGSVGVPHVGMQTPGAGVHTDATIFSEPLAMGTPAGFELPPIGQLNTDAVIVPYTLTAEDLGMEGSAPVGRGSFELDPDTLQIVAINLPSNAASVTTGIESVGTGVPMSSPVLVQPMSEPVLSAAPVPVPTPNAFDAPETSASVPPGRVLPGRERMANPSSQVQGAEVRRSQKTATASAGGNRDRVSAKPSPFIADNSGSSSAARAKPMAKRPPNRRRSRSQSVKGEMVESRASIVARAEEGATLEGPLLGGMIASQQPQIVKTVSNELPADPYAVMQDPLALVATPRYATGGVRILVLPYHERDNPNNLIYNTGGGEVVTTLFGIQLAAEPGVSVMWDATGKGTHNRLLSREAAIEMGRQAGADYVVRGQVVEFRRAQSVPSFYSAVISTAVLAAQLFFAEMSGVDVATEMYRVADGMCVMSRRDRSQQKYVVQAEKTVRRMAESMGKDISTVLRQPWPEPMDPFIDDLDPVSVMADPSR